VGGVLSRVSASNPHHRKRETKIEADETKTETCDFEMFKDTIKGNRTVFLGR